MKVNISLAFGCTLIDRKAKSEVKYRTILGNFDIDATIMVKPIKTKELLVLSVSIDELEVKQLKVFKSSKVEEKESDLVRTFFEQNYIFTGYLLNITLFEYGSLYKEAECFGVNHTISSVNTINGYLVFKFDAHPTKIPSYCFVEEDEEVLQQDYDQDLIYEIVNEFNKNLEKGMKTSNKQQYGKNQENLNYILEDL